MVENHVTLIGRLVKDVYFLSTKNGKSLVYFTLACGYGDKVEYINCSAWGKTAENLAAYTKKGSQIAAEGYVHQNEYQSNGKTEYRLEITVETVKLLDSKPKDKEELKEEALATVDDYLADQLPF